MSCGAARPLEPVASDTASFYPTETANDCKEYRVKSKNSKL